MTGAEGEILAAAFLEKRGYRVVARNFKSPYGEIDLIAWEKEMLVFIEVKSRSSTQFGGPAGAVNGHKQEKISRVAADYLQKNKLCCPCRFDVVCIVKEGAQSTVALFQNAFEMFSSAITV